MSHHYPDPGEQYGLDQLMPGPLNYPPRQPWWRKRAFIITAVATSVVALGATVWIATRPSGLEALADRDRYAAAACLGLTEWLDGNVRGDDGKPAPSFTVSMTIADLGSKAKSTSIRAAVGENVFSEDDLGTLREYSPDVDNFRFADLRKVHAACIEEGVAMPEFVEPN